MKKTVNKGNAPLDLDQLLMGMQRRSFYRLASGGLKITLVGPPQAGKSNLLERFLTGTYRETVPTIGFDFAGKIVNLAEENYWQHVKGEERMHLEKMRGTFRNIPVQFMDFSGMEQSLQYLGSLFQGTATLMLVFDRSDPASIHYLEYLLVKVREFLSGPPAVLVAAKADLANGTPRPVIDRFLDRHAISAFNLTSAKNGKGVEETFQEAFKLALQSL